MRMNLNQQGFGDGWKGQKRLMESMSPIVDCGVHYVDIMCLMTQSKPVRVHAIGARLSNEIAPEMYNYGQLQVMFEDGSIGWYEAGWGPMMSETAHFIKDVVGPKGAVSIAADKNGEGRSNDINSHTAVEKLRIHRIVRDKSGEWKGQDELYTAENEPDHYDLCRLEQEYLRDAIRNDLDMRAHVQEAVDSLRIVLAADESIRTGQTIDLE